MKKIVTMINQWSRNSSYYGLTKERVKSVASLDKDKIIVEFTLAKTTFERFKIIFFTYLICIIGTTIKIVYDIIWKILQIAALRATETNDTALLNLISYGFYLYIFLILAVIFTLHFMLKKYSFLNAQMQLIQCYLEGILK